MDIKTSRDNKDYIILNIAWTFGRLSTDKSTPKDILDHVNFVYHEAINFEKKAGYIGELAIRRDSMLGQFLINSNRIDNDDYYVSYGKVVNAYNIAIFEENPIALEILPLFRNQISGSKKELLKVQKEAAINYILENDDFKFYLANKRGEYKPTEIVVYENDGFSRRILSDSTKDKVKVKK